MEFPNCGSKYKCAVEMIFHLEFSPDILKIFESFESKLSQKIVWPPWTGEAAPKP